MSEPYTALEGLKAMTLFLWRQGELRGWGCVDLYDLVTDLALDELDRTMDPAAWADWTDCLRAIREGGDAPLRGPSPGRGETGAPQP